MINVEIKDGKVLVEGNDNYKGLRQTYADKLHAMNDEEYLKAAEQTIWLSAYANNNPRSDYHWQADVCIKEADVRGKPELYEQAYDNARASAGV